MEQIKTYVDEYAALALEAGRIKDRMDWQIGRASCRERV